MKDSGLLEQKSLVESFLSAGPQALIQFFFCQRVCLV